MQAKLTRNIRSNKACFPVSGVKDADHTLKRVGVVCVAQILLSVGIGNEYCCLVHDIDVFIIKVLMFLCVVVSSTLPC